MSNTELPLFLRIDAVLPQTQCTKCGYDGCKPYAQAIAAGEADINQCPPGGDANIHKLAAITGRPYQPLNPANGVEKPRQLAVIDEQMCIGCTLCIQACPVDAIVGAAKLMHSVITAECTGCDLCVAPCPVDCIAMIDAPADDLSEQQRADHARARFEFRQFRLQRDKQERAERLAAKAVEAKQAAARMAAAAAGDPAAAKAAADKQALIQAALARAAAKKAATSSPAAGQDQTASDGQAPKQPQ